MPGGVRRRQVDDQSHGGYRLVGDLPDAKSVDLDQSGKGRRWPHQQPIRTPFQVGAVIGDEPGKGQEPL